MTEQAISPLRRRMIVAVRPAAVLLFEIVAADQL
jgi:hypothetical protein